MWFARNARGKTKNMNLREFVGNALMQIIQGVKDAQNDGTADGALVNPRAVDIRGRVDQQSGLVAENGEPIRDVQFDVVVTVTQDSQANEGIGVSPMNSLAVGAQSELAASNHAVNRIRFRVPISLPSTD